jgi:hypothetical protein
VKIRIFKIGFELGLFWVCFLSGKVPNLMYLLVIKELKPIMALKQIGFELGLHWV